jgi:hypothetical protein
MRKFLIDLIGENYFVPIGSTKEAIDQAVQWVLSVGLLSSSSKLEKKILSINSISRQLSEEYLVSPFIFSRSPLIFGL